MSESSFITGGLIPVNTLIEKLGFQWAYAVNHKLEITETLVGANTSLEYEAHLDPSPKCGEAILFESLILARKYVFGKNIEKKKHSKKQSIQEKALSLINYLLFGISSSLAITGLNPPLIILQATLKKKLKTFIAIHTSK